MTSCSRIARILLAGVLLVLMTSPLGASAGRQSDDLEWPDRLAVDLATVPVPPDELPERGFQLAQAGRLDFPALLYAFSGDAQPVDSPLEDLYAEFDGAYSMQYVLHADRADASSEVLATVTTFVLAFADEDSAEVAAGDVAERLFLEDGDEIGGVTAFEDEDGSVAITTHDGYVVMVTYAFDEQAHATQQNTEDWSAEAMADLTEQTVDRLDDAIEVADSGEPQLGTATLQVVGEDALSGMPWAYYPMTDHYRVRDGEVLPYGGELQADSEAAVPDGIDDLFVSRQQLGDDGYDHMIDISLATFESEADAEDFAADPSPITFPPTWVFEMEYGQPETLDDGTVLQSARAEDDVVATGWRTISRQGTTVQVVTWLASDHAMTTREGMVELAHAQSECLTASPEPCAYLPQADFPAAVDDESAGSGEFPVATPVPGGGDDAVLAGLGYGWSVELPDDGWEVINVEFLAGTEYYQLQSGKSLLTIESVQDRAEDAADCVVSEAGLLEDLEERAVITLGSDDPDERKAGREDNHAWAVYTVEPLQEERADQEYTIRIDCYVLVPGEVSLVVTHTAPRDLWTEERDKGERFREAITLPATSPVADATTLIAGDNQAPWRTIAMGIPRIWIQLAA